MNFDHLIPDDKKANAKPSGINFDHLIPKSATAGDYLKQLGSSAIEGIGAIPQFGGELLAKGLNAATGSQTFRAENPLKFVVDPIRDSMTEGGKKAAADGFKGDVVDPSSYVFPENPSGWGMGIAQGFGSLASTVGPLAVGKLAGLGTKALTGVGATLGGATTGGAAAGEVREQMDKLTDADWATVPEYERLTASGVSKSEARAKIQNDSALYAGIGSGIAGTAGGAFNAKIFNDLIAKKGVSAALGKFSDSALVRAGAGAAGGVLVESAQEGLEKVGQNIGENIGRGDAALKDTTRDTLGDVVMGGIVGGGVGSVSGAVSRNPSAPPPANPANPGIPPAIPGNTPGIAPDNTGNTPAVIYDEQAGSIVDQISADAAQNAQSVRDAAMRAPKPASPLDPISQSAMQNLLMQSELDAQADEAARGAALDAQAAIDAAKLPDTGTISRSVNAGIDSGAIPVTMAGTIQDPATIPTQPQIDQQAQEQAAQQTQVTRGAAAKGAPDVATATAKSADAILDESHQALESGDTDAAIKLNKQAITLKKQAEQLTEADTKKITDPPITTSTGAASSDPTPLLKGATSNVPTYSGAPKSDKPKSQMPFTEVGAKARATELKKKDGKAYEVVPHPTAKGKFAVVESTESGEGLTKPVLPSSETKQTEVAQPLISSPAAASEAKAPETPQQAESLDNGKTPEWTNAHEKALNLAGEVAKIDGLASSAQPDNSALADKAFESAERAQDLLDTKSGATSKNGNSAKPAADKPAAKDAASQATVSPTDQPKGGEGGEGGVVAADAPSSTSQPDSSELPTSQPDSSTKSDAPSAQPETAPPQDAASDTGDQAKTADKKPTADEKPPGPTAAEKKPNKLAEARAKFRTKLEDHFTPGNIIFGDYWKQHDRVISFDWNNGAWSVKVQNVKKEGDGWVKDGEVRNHSTQPDAKDKVVETAKVETPAPVVEQDTAEKPAEIEAAKDKAVAEKVDAVIAAKWDAMGYGPRQDLAMASPYAKQRPVVHRLSGSKWAQLSPGEREEMTRVMAVTDAKVDKTAAKAEKEAEKVKAKARKLAERNLFTLAATDPGVIAAASAKTADEFAKDGNLFADLVANMASDAAGDVALVAALKGMVQDGKIVMPRAFFDSVYKEAKKAAEAAAATEKVTKEQSTGESLRRHWERLKKGVDSASADDMKKAWAQILRSTARADFFPILLADDATPGAKEWLPKLRDQIATFQEFYMREMVKNKHNSRPGRYRSDNAESVFLGKNTSYHGRLKEANFTSPAGTDEERLELTKIIAQEYQQYIQKLANKFDGLKSLDDIKTVIESTFGAPGDYKLGSMDAGDVAIYHNNESEIRKLFPYKAGDYYEKYSTWKRLSDTENEARAEGERKDALIRTRFDKITRNGLPDARAGRNISSEEFKKTFGLADVTIGHYVKAKESVDHLNYSYDALMTLAGMLGAKPAQLGFGGKLHFSIGALGHGKYAAHFSPNQPKADGTPVPVINVTNTRGDGAVLHEYFHAIDMLATDQKLMRAIDGIKKLLIHTPPKPEQVMRIARDFLIGGSHWTRNNGTPMENAELALSNYYAREERIAAKTDFYREARKLDAGNMAKPYWSNELEPFARMAEAWGLDTLIAQKANDDYLQSDWAADGKVTSPKYRGTPYPVKEERARLVTVFQSLVNNIEWTDAGPVLKELSPWQESSPWVQAMKPYHDERKRVLANLPEIHKQLLQEQADKKAQAEKDKADAIFGAKEEEPAEEPAETTDDLDAIFDDVAKGKREAQQETAPGTPEPGETIQQPLADTFTIEDLQVLRAQLGKGEYYLMAGDLGKPFGIPSIHDMPSADTRHMGMGAFKTTTSDYEANWDGGGAMSHLPSGIAYTSVSVTRGNFPYKRAQILEALDRKINSINARTGPKPATATKSLDEVAAKTAAVLATEMAKHGVTGIDEALKGLVKLFGGGPGKLQSFPGGFNQKDYDDAKPHFLKAAEAFKQAGLSFTEFVRKFFGAMIDTFGEGIKPYAVKFASEYKTQYSETPSVDVEPQAVNDLPASKLADWVLARVEAGTLTTWQELFNQADKEFGGTQAAAKYTPQDAYEALEMAINRHVIAQPISPNETAQEAELRAHDLEKLLSLVPTQTKRTAEKDEYQQFSTPPHFAAIANRVANLNASDVYLEPSAGVGGLAAFAKASGVKEIIVNEYSDRRLALIKTLPFDQFYGENAEQLHNVLPDAVKPTVIVMNPPFSSTAGRKEGSRDSMNGALHIEQALKRLQPGGRLVAIVGEGMGADRPAFREWWTKIGKEYNVRANIGVDGSSYVKYGTTFSNQILVIDKDGPTVGEIVTGNVAHPTEAIALLENVRDTRPARTGSEETTGVDSKAPGQRPGGTAAETDQGGKDGATSAARPPGGRGSGKSSTKSGSDAGAANANGDRGQTKTGDTGAAATGPANDGSASGTQPRANEGAGNTGDTQSSDIKLGEQAESLNKGEIGNSLFEQYTPSKVRIPGAIPHNTPLVESAALAAVVPPDPTYTPNLPKAIVTKGLLSDAQLEAVVYAGQAHQQMLRDGVTRRGFFLGDGTGVGKGRQISGMILDNMRQGRNKAVWISKKKELIVDAKRDFGDIGGNADLIFNYAKQKSDKAITEKEGILFAGYPTLRSESAMAKIHKKAAKLAGTGKKDGPTFERIQKMVDWLGEGYDGLIVFDESHEMGNAIAMRGSRGKKEPSQQALAALELQRALPNARVVYVSATGATEVSNLAYAERLGLWGDGTPFSNVINFASEMGQSVSAMELVAQNLKQMGLYLARSLSYNGVQYAKLQHELTGYQRDTYDTLATAWQSVLSNIDAALEDNGASEGKDAGKIKGAIMSMFWGSHQRFFNQILTAAQMPSVISQIEEDLKAGKAVVLQLTSTNEADQNRALAKMASQKAEKLAAGEEADEESFEEMDLTPRDQLITMLEKAFPVQQFESYTDEDGNERLRPVVDKEGKPVLNKVSVAKRDALIAEVRNMHIPDAALPMLINHFGPEAVAEITGRTQRVIRGDDGKINKVQKLSPATVQADSDAFKNDKKKILIFSQAGGTGFSFHADLRYKNQRPRVHYILQPGWSADKVIQGLGRTHRTNQSSAPMYRLVSTDAPAQKRFISSVARRIEQLGALTGGQRDSAGGGSVFSASDNLESAYAARAVRQFFESVTGGRTFDGIPDDLLAQLGLQKVADENGKLNESGLPTITQFLNRLLSLRLDTQTVVFEAFIQQIDLQVEAAKQQGTFDDGLQTIRHVGAEVRIEKPVYTDPLTHAVTNFVEVAYKLTNKIHPFATANRATSGAKKGGWFVNKQSGRIAGVYETMLTRTDKDGRIHALYGFWRTSGPSTEIASKFDLGSWTRLKVEEALPIWEKENEERPKTTTKKLNMVVGGILPLWDRFNNTYIQVARIGTDDGRRFLGRQIADKDLESTLQKLNVESDVAKMAGADIIAALKEGKIVELSNGMGFKMVRVSGDKRIELTQGNQWLDAAKERNLKAAGIFMERIEYKQRLFAPNAEAIDKAMYSLSVNPYRVHSEDDVSGSALQKRTKNTSAPRLPYNNPNEDLSNFNRYDAANDKPSQALRGAIKAFESANPGFQIDPLGNSRVIVSKLDKSNLAESLEKLKAFGDANNVAVGISSKTADYSSFSPLSGFRPYAQRADDEIGGRTTYERESFHFARIVGIYVPSSIEGEVRMRRTAPNDGMTAAEVRDAIKSFQLDRPVTVFQTVAELNKAIGEQLESDTAGAAKQRHIYLVADNLTDALDVEKTLFHESFHVGLRARFNGDIAGYHKSLRGLALRNQKLAQAAKVWRDQFGADARARMKLNDNALFALSIEEALADLSGEQGAALKGLRPVLAALQKIMRAMGFEKLANWLESRSDAEAVSFIADMRRNPEAKAEPVGGMAVASRTGATDQTDSEQAEEIDVEGYSSVDVRHREDGYVSFSASTRVNGQPYFTNVMFRRNDEGEWVGGNSPKHETFTGKTVRAEARHALNDKFEVLREAAINHLNRNPKNPTQAPSDPLEASIVQSRIADAIKSDGIQKAITEKAAILFETQRSFNLFHRTIGTQYHKSTIDRDYKPVYESGQNYLKDIATIANESADLAPSLLPKLSDSVIAALTVKGVSKADETAVSGVIFNGTLADTLYTSAEEAGLTPAQFKLYQQARNAIDHSLDAMLTAESARTARKVPGIGSVIKIAKATSNPHVISDHVMRASKQELDPARASELESMAISIDEKVRRVAELKAKGYAPLSRFGNHTVYVTQGDEQLSFTLHESQRDANQTAQTMRELYPDAVVTQGLLSQEASKLFQGVSPDTLELFGDVTTVGPDGKEVFLSQTKVFQDYLKLAVNNRSALKRLIKRKGIAGFSTDLNRVLATFITSNARAASGSYHFGDMLDAANAIPKEKGDVKDDAVKLLQYLQNPVEEAAALRGFLFVQYLGGSIASAMVNMTQPILQTLPYLQQFGNASKHLAKALTMIGKKATITDPELKAALLRAEKDGVVSPQEIHQLYAESSRTFGSNRLLRRGLTVWGSLFSLAEQFNRRITFIAAFNLAKEKGIPNAFEFAEKAVAETQGVYNRGNRPNWARGPVGATLFTFKQFSIAYLEFLKRLPPKERALALAILVLAAGIQGLPGADDLDDIIDALAQSMGYNWNSKQEKHKFLASTLGSGFANFVMNGVSTIPGMPLDVQGRLGLGNLIPGTAALKKSEVNKTRDTLAILGPAGGLLQSSVDAAGKLVDGDVLGAAKKGLPIAIQNALKSYDMLQMGMYRDEKGRKVLDTDAYDAFVKGIGFQPANVAEASRTARSVNQNIALVKVREGEISEKLAQGYFEKDPAKVEEARKELLQWNRTNPEAIIRITPAQVGRRVKEMNLARDQRIVKTAPREVRADIRSQLVPG